MKIGSKHPNAILYGILISLMIGILLLGTLLYAQSNKNIATIAFLDIGQGDAIFIEAPNRKQVLIDAGPDSGVVRALSQVMPFWDRSIDIIIPSHADKDHIGGFPEVLRRFVIDVVYDTQNTASTSIYQTYARDRDDEHAFVSTATYSDTIILDGDEGVYLRVLYPDQDVSDLERNDSSTVIQFVYGDIEILLTGDAGRMVEEYLVYEYGPYLQSEILKAGHHGSRTSSSSLFFEFVQPEYVIISAGENNSYGHPHQEVVELIERSGAQMLETSQEGTIVFETDGEEIWVK